MNSSDANPKSKMSKSKQGCFGCLGLIVILIVIGAIFGNSGSDSSKQASKQQQVKEPEYNYTCDVQGVGKVKGLFVSDVGVAIFETKDVDSIDSSFSTTKAQGIFKIVSVVVSNNQKDAITMDGNSFKLIDDKGREFSYSVHGSTALQMKGRNTLFLEQINPGNTVSGVIPFDVPKDANIVKMVFTGGFSGKKGELPYKIMKAE
ncbi:DUF4352 domain-containing protein [Pelosinus baikalensis]|uniref:DUF4352 domain-containing protein n=1 Tax=Pelosinus baikalensis TaxID=2892015 RepID=A0ABS8I043_9FIRM|nr:DUF4352 domain-containing protein [Pelosinus baikalensis]MCC5467664.1 DUF4352 domain-containing protein [Pelosinus baikalensis]